METSVLNFRDTNVPAIRAASGDNTTVGDISGTGSRADGNNSCSFPPNANNVVHQRRRVNPESLAKRLGPDLVRDLDALITSGNTEMPSFAVRKELQERYNIDRRHIYDYFHSRGLRVVKEDKHGNPMTVKDVPTPLPNLRPLRQAPAKNFRSHPYSVAAERKLVKPRGLTKAKPGRPKKNPPANPKVVPITCETDESDESLDTNDVPTPENSPGEVPTPAYITVNPLLPHIPLTSTVEDNGRTFNSIVSPPDELFSASHTVIGEVAYAHRHKLVLEGAQELTEYSIKLALTDDPSLLWSEVSPSFVSGKGLFPHAKTLTRDERRAVYESISDSLGPAQGIQECQGTYRKYMQGRTKLYFEGLLLAGHHHSQQPSGTSVISDRRPSMGTNEFRHWLSETRFLKRDVTSGSPRLYISHRNANVAKQQETDATNQQDRQISIPHWIRTLDDLFPAPGDALDTDDAMTDSPVVHTRDVTEMATQARGVVECSAGGRLPFSVATSPLHPITSVAETRQTGHTGLHGVSGFPGTQEIKTRIPISDMDSHPLWHSHSGRRLTLTDTQCRGRNISSNARLGLPSCNPRRLQLRDLDYDGIWTRSVTSRDTRRRTPSAAGDI